MPQLPPATRARLQTHFGLSTRDTDVLMAVDAGREVRFDGEPARGAVAYFEQLCAERGRAPRVVVNWCVSIVVQHARADALLRITHELLGQLAARKETFGDNPLSVGQMGELIDMAECGAITRMF